MSESDPILECRDMVLGYGSAPVIHELSLVVRPGEIVALLGPNGAGKSTTLLGLAGLLPLSGGEVWLDGRFTKASLHRRARKGVSFAPEGNAVFRELTCAENLRVGRADPAATLELFPELRDRLHVPGGLLSGGEQQMLTLGRALSLKPRVLLVDELSLGLAPLIVRKLLRAVREAADRGCGVVLVEQHLTEALAVADTAHVLRRGHVELSGPAAEMAARVTEIEERYLSHEVRPEGSDTEPGRSFT
jgi:branched-chain amino acid transport system ATP-binding protein